jgi:hypothetical protein
MLGRLKIMQDFHGQILNFPIIYDIGIAININYLSENGSVPGDGRVRPLAAESDPDREKT